MLYSFRYLVARRKKKSNLRVPRNEIASVTKTKTWTEPPRGVYLQTTRVCRTHACGVGTRGDARAEKHKNQCEALKAHLKILNSTPSRLDFFFYTFTRGSDDAHCPQIWQRVRASRPQVLRVLNARVNRLRHGDDGVRARTSCSIMTI